MDNLFTFFAVAMSIIMLSRAIAARATAKKEAELLERNPEAWKKVQELKMEKKDRDRRAAGGAALTIAKIFLKK